MVENGKAIKLQILSRRKNNMRKAVGLRRSMIIHWLLALCLLVAVQTPVFADESGIKNVIILMMDGTGSAHTTITRWYKGEPLALDSMSLGGVRTYSADSLITDSAPAATAFATGHKSNDKFVGVLPGVVTIPGVPQISDDLKYKPVATVLEGAKLTGKSAGLVATSNIQHASPAGYSAHWPARSNYNEIAEQQVYLDIDVVFGGGKKYLIPNAQGGARTDGENLIDLLRSRGYEIVETRNEMLETKAKKVWGLFAEDAMSYEYDREMFTPAQPALAEMTQEAIEILSKNEKGFFLFVEGSKIDWASHANDPIGVIGDVLAFDDAVRVALDFASRDKKTLVLAFSDHGNGGMSLGNKSTDATYSKFPLEALVTPLRKATLTGEGIEKVLAGDRSESNIRSVLLRYYGIDDLSDSEITAIQNAPAGKMNYVVGPMISSRSKIGWTTNGHVGEDLFLYVYGLKNPLGMIENTQIAHLSARSLGFDLADVDSKLFQQADRAFMNIGATVRIDTTDTANPLLVVEKGSAYAELPFSKDVMRIGKRGKVNEYELEGITVFAPNTGKVYVPEQAVRLFNMNSR